jgi:hypothetical protein
MSNDKQQTAVDIIYQGMSDKIVMQDLNKALICIHISHDDFLKLHRQAKEMEVAGKEMSYADGYSEGYKRALEMVEWYIKNYISGMPQDHIGDTNKKVDE